MQPENGIQLTRKLSRFHDTLTACGETTGVNSVQEISTCIFIIQRISYRIGCTTYIVIQVPPACSTYVLHTVLTIVAATDMPPHTATYIQYNIIRMRDLCEMNSIKFTRYGCMMCGIYILLLPFP